MSCTHNFTAEPINVNTDSFKWDYEAKMESTSLE